jgi:hypothetical protein
VGFGSFRGWPASMLLRCRFNESAGLLAGSIPSASTASGNLWVISPWDAKAREQCARGGRVDAIEVRTKDPAVGARQSRRVERVPAKIAGVRY